MCRRTEAERAGNPAVGNGVEEDIALLGMALKNSAA